MGRSIGGGGEERLNSYLTIHKSHKQMLLLGASPSASDFVTFQIWIRIIILVVAGLSAIEER